MSARDELAAVIVEAYGENPDMCPCEQDLDVADAILAAGYTKPRTITTAEELDARKFLMNQQAAPHWVDAPGDQKRAVSFDVDKRDGEFIAAARTDVPALLAYARDLEARLGRVEALANYLDRLASGDKHYAGLIRAALTATEARA